MRILPSLAITIFFCGILNLVACDFAGGEGGCSSDADCADGISCVDKKCYVPIPDAGDDEMDAGDAG